MTTQPEDFQLVPPGLQANERDTLMQFLDYYRTVLARKAAGLTSAQLSINLAPSQLTLGGLLKHMAVVEDNWFVRRWEGGEYSEPWASAPWEEDRDWELNSSSGDSPEYLFELYRIAIERSDRIVAGVDSLDARSVRARDGENWSLRWILVHLIEEYARHCGHADLIRESIDGAIED
jgi:hypothetical protein